MWCTLGMHHRQLMQKTILPVNVLPCHILICPWPKVNWSWKFGTDLFKNILVKKLYQMCANKIDQWLHTVEKVNEWITTTFSAPTVLVWLHKEQWRSKNMVRGNYPTSSWSYSSLEWVHQCLLKCNCVDWWSSSIILQAGCPSWHQPTVNLNLV